MKKLLAVAALACSVFALSAAAEDLTGIITDAKCKHTDTSAKSVACAKQCIQAGSPAVLVTSADNKVYTIANPSKITRYIGQRVTVSGDVNGDKVTVNSVKPASSGEGGQ